jgi:hypothetical protein
MRGAIPPLPNTPSWRGAQLKKAQGQLYRLTVKLLKAVRICARY